MSDALIALAGTGNSAKITALALAEAGLPVALAKAAQTPLPDWQSVLALSPAAKTMLETLSVWARLDRPSAPLLDMRVYGRTDDVGADVGADVDADVSAGVGANLGDWPGTARLAFAPDTPIDKPIDKPLNKPNDSEPETAAISPPAHMSPLAHIVSLAALGRAIDTALDAAIAAKQVRLLAADIADFDPSSMTLTLANGDRLPVGLLVDTLRAAPPWRQRLAARPMRYDYQAKALVGTVQTGRHHGYVAHQIFLPTGALALLPLPQTNLYAMVWSLPQAKADALAQAPADILAYELAQATQNRFGILTGQGAMATQPLSLQLAEKPVDGGHVLLGEAAHTLHPLAGQGFNLTLRDAAQLADCLFDARRFGLALSDGAMLAAYEKSRRADAALTAATTHGLARLFGSVLAPWGRWGLAMVGRAAQNNPSWRTRFSAQANQGISTPVPRLLRGVSFTG